MIDQKDTCFGPEFFAQLGSLWAEAFSYLAIIFPEETFPVEGE